MRRSNKTSNNLIKDSAEADKSGLSYGKWMALQYEAGRRSVAPKKPDAPEPNTVCRWCGEGFYAPHKHKRVFCSDLCRASHSSMIANERRKLSR